MELFNAVSLYSSGIQQTYLWCLWEVVGLFLLFVLDFGPAPNQSSFIISLHSGSPWVKLLFFFFLLQDSFSFVLRHYIFLGSKTIFLSSTLMLHVSEHFEFCVSFLVCFRTSMYCSKILILHDKSPKLWTFLEKKLTKILGPCFISR